MSARKRFGVYGSIGMLMIAPGVSRADDSPMEHAMRQFRSVRSIKELRQDPYLVAEHLGSGLACAEDDPKLDAYYRVTLERYAKLKAYESLLGNETREAKEARRKLLAEARAMSELAITLMVGSAILFTGGIAASAVATADEVGLALMMDLGASGEIFTVFGGATMVAGIGVGFGVSESISGDEGDLELEYVRTRRAVRRLRELLLEAEEKCPRVAATDAPVQAEGETASAGGMAHVEMEAMRLSPAARAL